MTIGFLTSCLRKVALPEVMTWAGENGFAALEIWAGAPKETDAPYEGASLNPWAVTVEAAEDLRRLADECGIEISCLTYCVNQLDPDPAKREGYRAHLLKVIEAAALLDVDVVSCFVGRNGRKTVEGCLEDFREVFEPVMAAAAEKGVRIAIENWPGLGVPFEGLVGNIACSPPLWRKMFEIFPDLGLNYDPSHLVWQGIDYLDPIREFARHIYHVHAKDTEVLEEVLADRGFLPSPAPRWFRYRAPGFGSVNWARFVSALVENGYDGVLSIEHEDPVFSGDEALTRRGLILGRRHLAPFVE